MKFRVLHRYLGFFLAGIMMMYAFSGIILVFRKTDTFKVPVEVTQELEANMTPEAVGAALRINDLSVQRAEGPVLYFDQGQYDASTGVAVYTKMQLPGWLETLTHFHKATTADPLYYFNLFFGASLFFFAFSAFFMYAVQTPIFKKGLYFTIAGIILAIIMLLV